MYELEHTPGSTDKQIKEAEKEFIKNNLAEKLGWAREEFDEKLEEMKEFLNLYCKDKFRRKHGK